MKLSSIGRGHFQAALLSIDELFLKIIVLDDTQDLPAHFGHELRVTSLRNCCRFFSFCIRNSWITSRKASMMWEWKKLSSKLPLTTTYVENLDVRNQTLTISMSTKWLRRGRFMLRNSNLGAMPRCSTVQFNTRSGSSLFPPLQWVPPLKT